MHTNAKNIICWIFTHIVKWMHRYTLLLTIYSWLLVKYKIRRQSRKNWSIKEQLFCCVRHLICYLIRSQNGVIYGHHAHSTQQKQSFGIQFTVHFIQIPLLCRKLFVFNYQICTVTAVGWVPTVLQQMSLAMIGIRVQLLKWSICMCASLNRQVLLCAGFELINSLFIKK